MARERTYPLLTLALIALGLLLSSCDGEPSSVRIGNVNLLFTLDMGKHASRHLITVP